MTSDGEERPVAVGPRTGEQLRAAREADGMDLEEVASRTRVPIRHLRMIEAGEYVGLPAATYSAGFVKSYARLLGLDAQDLSERFRAEVERETVPSQRPAPFEPADPRRTPPLGLALAVLLVAMVAILGFLYWRGSGEQPTRLAANGVRTAPAAAPTAGPRVAPAPAAPAVPAAPAGGAVVIGASQEVWIKVAAGGRTLFMGTLTPGRTFPVPADAVDPLLTTGRPGNTLVSVGGRALPPVGDPDRAAHDVSLKPADLLAHAAAAPAAGSVAGTPPPAS